MRIQLRMVEAKTVSNSFKSYMTLMILLKYHQFMSWIMNTSIWPPKLPMVKTKCSLSCGLWTHEFCPESI